MKTFNVFRRNYAFFIAFFCPILILGAAYALSGMYPFGDKTILISDMSGQYLDFYSELHDMLTQGKSLFYSWHAGMGHNFTGIIAYYLSSPFSLLILLFEKEQLPEVLMLITLLKIGFSGLTFALFARNHFQGPQVAIAGFSLIYALMSYSIVYAFNIMWLDGIIMLPLILLGIERLIYERRGLLLGVSLWVLFVANFYIAYMIGIFSCLYWLITYSLHHNLRPFRLTAARFARFVGIALLSAGCAAFVLVPTYFALMNGPNSFVFSQLFEVKFNFPLFDLLSKIFPGSYDSLSYGLPNIAVGLLPLILLPGFIYSPVVPLKEKIAYWLLLLLLIASFALSNLNIAWHAFDHPDWFPYRYSFLFSFVLILLAFRAYRHLRPEDTLRLFKTYGALLFLIVLLQKLKYDYLAPKMILVNFALLSLYFGVLLILIHRPDRRRLIAIALIGLIICEGLFNSWYLIRRMDSQFGYITKTAYTQTMTPLKDLVTRIQAEDDGFYRLERVRGRTHNDALNIGYNGIAHFSSLSNGPLHSFLQSLGFAGWAGFKVLNYSGSTLVTDSLFGVKYKISPYPLGYGYQPILEYSTTNAQTGKADVYKVYENRYALPLGFMVSKAILELDPSAATPFELQNILLNRCLGIEPGDPRFVPYFTPLSADQILMENIVLESDEPESFYQRLDTTRDSFIHFRLSNPPNRPIYASLPNSLINIRASVNGRDLGSYSSAYRLIDLGEINPGQPLTLSYKIVAPSHPYTPQPFYTLNTGRFTQALATLKQRGMQDLVVTSREVMGKITAQAGEILFTTIPYDPGWQAFVDGREVPVLKIADAFIGLELSPGTHEILFTFSPPGWALGLAISGISLAISIWLVFRSAYRRRLENRAVKNVKGKHWR